MRRLGSSRGPLLLPEKTSHIVGPSGAIRSLPIAREAMVDRPVPGILPGMTTSRLGSIQPVPAR
jgi:hypothetical protein